MRNSEEQQKQDSLKELFFDLSRSQDVLRDPKRKRDYFLRLEDIYYKDDGNFRHYYSNIFSWLTMICKDSTLGNLDILAQNIKTIKDGYVPKNTDDNGKLIDISKEIIKLYDHTNLDISRINYTTQITGETESELAKVKTLINDLENKIKESETARADAIKDLGEKSEKLKEEVRNGQTKMQNEYITILGIFAAIVLAFTGGVSFSTSVLENIEKASPYRILTIVSLLGLILYNIIWLLIDFLRDINGKRIRKWWLILVTDIIIIVGLILSFAAYKYQWLEIKQDVKEQVHQESSQNIETEISIPVE